MMIETKRRGRMFSLAFGCLALAASGAVAKQGIAEGRLKILAKTLDESWSRKSSLEEFFIFLETESRFCTKHLVGKIEKMRFRWRNGVFIASPLKLRL